MRVKEPPQQHTVRPSEPSESTAEQSLERFALYRIGLAYGRLVYRFRWLILVLWVAGVAASAPFAAKVTSVLNGGGYSYSGSESVHVATLLTDRLHLPPAQLLVVFQSSATPVSDAAFQQEVQDFISRAKLFPHVTGAVQGGTGSDNLTT
jgi:uncharacterized membrane protein YdfJ with MMPL/SSD domain